MHSREMIRREAYRQTSATETDNSHSPLPTPHSQLPAIRVKVGQPARVYLDSDPDKPIEAYVSRVDPEATFTPENTYFRNERVKQVVGVKLQLKTGFGFAKPGMPADGEILIQGDKWPEGKWRR